MVQDTGKTLHVVTFKPLNLPEPIGVEEDSGGLPTGLTGRNTQVIAAVEDIWRLDDEWWRSMPLERIYFAVLLTSGQRCVIFKDLSAKRWYRQAY